VDPPRPTRWVLLVAVVAVTVVLVAVALVQLADGPDPPVDLGEPTADLRNGRTFIQDNLWSTPEHQYAVWVAPDGTPFAGRRLRGSEDWEVTNLAQIPGNPLAAPTADDEHNVYAIAVDASGYVHVAGNMHADPTRYIRSVRPGDLGEWQTAEFARSSAEVTYPQFVGLPDGTLLFFRREGVAGEGTVHLDALDPGAAEWRHVGAVLASPETGESAYLHDVAVDARSGSVHLLFEWRATGGSDTNNDVGYARSRDRGRTWETTDGRRLSLPISHATAETVVDTRPANSGLRNSGGLTVDADGHPHGVIVLEPVPGSRALEHVWHDGSTWQRTELDGSLLDGRPAIATSREGRVWMFGAKGGRLEAVDITDGSDGPRRSLAAVPPSWEATFDTEALRRFERIEILVPDAAAPRVVVTDLAPG
jgi:hypothetical protein